MSGMVKGFKWNENIDWLAIDEEDVDTSTLYGKLTLAAIKERKRQATTTQKTSRGLPNE